MIGFLSGVVRFKGALQVLLDCNGIGFELTVPLSTSSQLGSAGTPAELFVQSVFTREGMSLYGFKTQDEKDAFNRLTSVRGIGPRAGLNLLSRFAPAEINAIVSQGKVETLKTVPGIGPKKADMLLGKLREAVPPAPGALPLVEDALGALTALGLTRREALARLEKIPNRATLTLNELLAQALRESRTA